MQKTGKDSRFHNIMLSFAWLPPGPLLTDAHQGRSGQKHGRKPDSGGIAGVGTVRVVPDHQSGFGFAVPEFEYHTVFARFQRFQVPGPDPEEEIENILSDTVDGLF